MTHNNLIKICEKDGLYEFPEMNNKLYLHFKGFRKIENLSLFINLRTLYLENNLIEKIENLDCLPNLEFLFLQNNLIKEITNLDKNLRLKAINLHQNSILKIDNLAHLKELSNLDLSNNYIKTFEQLEHLKELKSIETLTLTQNQIEYDEKILGLFGCMSQLKCVYLSGNDFYRQCPKYRQQMVGTCKQLQYLDERPVTIKERRCADKFIEGGDEAYKLESEKIKQEELQQKMQEHIELQKKS